MVFLPPPRPEVKVSEDPVEGLLVGILAGDPLGEAENVPPTGKGVRVVVMVTVWESRVG